MTFDAGVHPDPAALQQAVRDADFTPTSVRFWARGRIESRQVPGAERLAALILVSAGSGQRFVLAAEQDTGAALSALEGTTVTVWGRVTASERSAELILQVEGHTIDSQ